MNDGDKAKAKAVKAKTSRKEVSRKVSAKEKGGKTVKTGAKKESISSVKAEAAKKGSGKGGTKGSALQGSPKAGAKAGANAKTTSKTIRAEPEAITFTNPTIENAFRRAVKKYPNAFRKLTD